MNLMVTTNQKPIFDTQKIKSKESKHITKQSHQCTGEENKRGRKEQKRTTRNNQKTINKMATSTHLSIIPLNVNGLSGPIKRHRVAESIKTDQCLCHRQETQFRWKDTHNLKAKGWKKILHAN